MLGCLSGGLEAEGYDPITIANAVTAYKAGNKEQAEAIVHAANHAQAALKKKQELIENPPAIHGDAHFASQAELDTAGLVGAGGDTVGSLFFGHHEETGEPLYWNGESHLLTLAPTRTGKSTVQIIPNLLRYKGSAVVLDPKGELAEATAKWRKENVGPIFKINPFAVPSLGTGSNSFNPLDMVKDDRSAREMAEMLYPRSEDSKQRFFDNEAIGFLAGVIEYFALYKDGKDRSIGTMRDITANIDGAFWQLLREMKANDMPASIRNAARNVESKSEDGRSRMLDSINQYMQMWDTQALRDVTSKSDFTFTSLKDRPATVYLVLPFNDLAPYSTFVQIVFAAALNAMLDNRIKPEIPVLFVLDEFLALDRSDKFVDALRTHASAGVRLWFFLQDLATLRHRYPENWQSFLQVEVKTFFGTDDKETAAYISEYLGFKTEAVADPTSGTTSIGGSATSYTIDEKYSYQKIALMTPDQVERYMASFDLSKPRRGLVFFRGGLRAKAKLTPWHLDRAVKDRCGLEWKS
ncbi:type IV secretory system conjugative DNA transfer family protein [uncultured Cohaesibacter sp.]|uniref:type IV secretory system conjugative DNA transfer family protein n=1 Tax=uncultured Cohaesibacter sp. TaxID=1002546 RepID=UPI00292FD545|nr:type IV secretory system conjugative DNA transfer family protein [uncultured Cohaesibacter sp.]